VERNIVVKRVPMQSVSQKSHANAIIPRVRAKSWRHESRNTLDRPHGFVSPRCWDEVTSDSPVALLLAGLRGVVSELFRVPVGIPGVFQRLLWEFVSRKMISFAVSGGGGAVSVRRKVMEFGGSIVGTLGHIALLSNLMRLTRTRSHAVRAAPSAGWWLRKPKQGNDPECSQQTLVTLIKIAQF
jgi:hypothetical protein